jgi:hypothetical protein
MVAGAVLASMSCGSRSLVAPVGPGRPIQPTVRFYGGHIAGALYVLAGSAPADVEAGSESDVYLIRGMFADAARLTYSPVGLLGFYAISADGQDVLVSDFRGLSLVDRGDQITRLFVRGRTARLGPGLTAGEGPVVGPGGRYLFQRFIGVGHRFAAYSVVYVARLGRRGARAVLKTAPTRDGEPVPGYAWGPGSEIAVLTGAGRKARVTLDAGTSHARTVKTPGFSYLIGGGPQGTQALHRPPERSGCCRGAVTFASCGHGGSWSVSLPTDATALSAMRLKTSSD